MKISPNNRCDLHIHSTFSDSDSSVESIFKQAKDAGLRCISITDHDTVEGISSAREYAKIYNVDLIEGIELSAEHKNMEVHILGYFIDSENPKLRSELAAIKDLRWERVIWMAERLNFLGLGLDVGELLASIGQAIPTRLHLALYLVQMQKATSLRDVFRKYLSPGRPAYRARFKHSVRQIIQLIKDCGGLAFLAHPHMIPTQSWVEDFVVLGLDGVELAYPGMSAAKRSCYGNMILQHGLLRSGGSDAHGSYKEFTGIGGVSIPHEWVLDMERRLTKVNR